MPSTSRLEARKLLLAKTIRSLPEGAKSSLETLSPEIPLSKQSRQCDCCGILIANPSHAVQRFCSHACNARWWMNIPEFYGKVNGRESKEKAGKGRSAWLKSEHPKAQAEMKRIAELNPTSRPEVREKLSRRLKEIGHKPPIQGGNGRGLTEPQRRLMEVLGMAWEAEYAVRLGPAKDGYPTNYKVDLANPETMIAIEVDGNSHLSRRALDAKKDAKLASLGWTVLRFWNREILDWIDSGMPAESSISTTFKRHGIAHFPFLDY